MYDIEKFKEKLKSEVKASRYEHSLSVMNFSVELAKYYGVDEEKARVAGLLHDCAKYKDTDKILQKAKEFDIIIDGDLNHTIKVLHALLGYYIARDEYGIEDEEVLLAIKNHALGRENMSDLEKIVFYADFAEPLRTYSMAEKLREFKYEGLTKAAYEAVNYNLCYILEEGLYVHPQSLKTRNSLLLELKGE